MAPVERELGPLARPDCQLRAAELEKELTAVYPVPDREHDANEDHHQQGRCNRQKDGRHLHSGVCSRLHEIIGRSKRDAGDEGQANQPS